MADIEFGSSDEGGYFIIDKNLTGNTYRFYVTNRTNSDADNLMSVYNDSRFVLGKPDNPPFEIDWQGQKILLSDTNWAIQHNGSSTTPNIDIISNDDISLVYGNVTNASNPLFTIRKGSENAFQLDSSRQARFYSTLQVDGNTTMDGSLTVNQTINAEVGLQSRGVVLCDRDDPVSPNQPGIWALTDIAGTKYYFWASDQNVVRFSPGVIPTAANQDTLGRVVPLPAVVGPFTSNYTANYNETVLVDPSAGAVQVTLPSVSDFEGGIITIKNASISTNLIQIITDGRDQIDNSRGAAIQRDSGFIVLQSDGITDWWSIGGRSD